MRSAFGAFRRRLVVLCAASALEAAAAEPPGASGPAPVSGPPGMSEPASEPSRAPPDAGEPVRFDYSAPEGCPDSGTFEALVREKSSRAREARAGELARAFSVRITGDGAAMSAELGFVDRAGTPVTRAVRGESCEDVVRAIALVTALAVDAQLPPPETPSPPPPATASPAPESRPPPPVDSAPSPAPRPEAHPPAPPPTIEVGLLGVLRSFQGPGAALGASGYGEVSWTRGPSLRALFEGLVSSASVPRPDDPSVERGAEFVLLAGRFEVCPLGVALGRGLELWPCASLGLGRLEGAGQESAGLSPARTSAIVWADAIAGLRFEWAPAESLFVLTLSPELGVPLRRHEFVAEGPRQRVFAVPAAGVGVTGGAGLRFR